MAAKEIALVTGANSGIGFEIAHQLLASGSYHVLLACRSPSKGHAALQDLQSRSLPGTLELVPLDLQSDEQIHALAHTITTSHGTLDLLVNNAAIASSHGPSERHRLQAAFDTNATGPYLLTKALLPVLRRSANPRVINVSSGAGSIGRRLCADSPMYGIQAVAYRASKTAWNMMSACLHVEFGLGVEQVDGEDKAKATEEEEEEEEEEKPRPIKVFCYDPGFTVSNLSPHNTKQHGARDAAHTVAGVMELVEGKRDAEVGRFLHNSGEYPW